MRKLFQGKYRAVFANVFGANVAPTAHADTSLHAHLQAHNDALLDKA